MTPGATPTSRTIPARRARAGPGHFRATAQNRVTAAEQACVTVGTDKHGGEADERAARRLSGPRPYDFRRPNKLSRDHMRLLQIAGETFARQFGTVLTTTLRTVSTVTLVSVEQLTYDEYIRAMDTPSFMAVISLSPLDGAGVLHLPLRTAMLTVDHLLGGTGKGEQPQRALSDIEQGLLRAVVERLLHELAYAFESLTPLEPQVVQIESNPRFAQVAASSDMMVVTSLDVRLGTTDSIVTLCLPLDSLTPTLEAATAPIGPGARDSASLKQFVTGLRHRLHDVAVDVSVRFAPVTMTPTEVLDLRVGDVVRLPHPVTHPLAVTASGAATAYAVPGTKGRRLACRIVPRPEEPIS